MLNQEIQELAVSLGFHLEESKIYVYRENHLEYTISNTIISVLDKTNRGIETYPTSKKNILKVMNVSETIEEIEPLDLSISKDGCVINSEVKNRAMAKMNDEFMSQPFTIDDCKILKFLPFDDGVGLSWGSLTFMFRQLDIRLFVVHQGLSIKSLDNPTRKQVDEVYHFFTGEHLDFSPKQKVYNWENCFDYNGWFIHSNAVIHKSHSTDTKITNTNTYPTKEDAEAALAYCQLLHIVNKINEDYPNVDVTDNKDRKFYLNINAGSNNINISSLFSYRYETLVLYSYEGAKVLIRDNEELLKTYFKIK